MHNPLFLLHVLDITSQHLCIARMNVYCTFMKGNTVGSGWLCPRCACTHYEALIIVRLGWENTKT